MIALSLLKPPIAKACKPTHALEGLEKSSSKNKQGWFCSWESVSFFANISKGRAFLLKDLTND